MSSTTLAKQYYSVFSRTAKTFDEKNNLILQDRNSMLLNKLQTSKPKNTPKKRRTPQASPPIQPPTPAKPSAAFLTQSREDFYKDPSPSPQVSLTVNKEVLWPQPRVCTMTVRPATQARVKRAELRPEFYAARKPDQRPGGVPQFDKQLGRTFVYTSLHEQRFVPFNDTPAHLSSTRRVSVPSLAHGRGHAFPVRVCENSAFYKSVAGRPMTGVLLFSKGQSRKPLLVDSMHDLCYENVSYSLTEKRGPSASFGCQRNSNPTLPSYMIVRLSLIHI